MLESKEIIIRLALAAFFGALIGLERGRIHWAAGLRTHMMVAVGSSLIMIVSSFGFNDILGSKNVELDPSRVAAQVVSGIGFIGAGAILFMKQGTVRGLTTAAGLWTVAAIGLATGGGLYLAASITTVISLVILWALHPIEHMIYKKYKPMTLKIATKSQEIDAETFQIIFDQNKLVVERFTFEKINDNFVYRFRFENVDNKKIEKIIHLLKDDKALHEISLI